jgi:hypothetical protein
VVPLGERQFLNWQRESNIAQNGCYNFATVSNNTGRSNRIREPGRTNWAHAHETPTKPMNRDGTGHAGMARKVLKLHTTAFLPIVYPERGREFESLTAYQPSR